MKQTMWLLSVSVFLFVGCSSVQNVKVKCVYENQTDCVGDLNNPAIVYMTKDVSARGLEKVYQALLPEGSQDVWVHEYAPASFIFQLPKNYKDLEKGYDLWNDFSNVPADLSNVFGKTSNLNLLSPARHDREKFDYARMFSCLELRSDQSTQLEVAKGCDPSFWKGWREQLHEYAQQLLTHQTVVVLSQATVESSPSYLVNGKLKADVWISDGMFDNMLGGSGFHDGGINPILFWWNQRLVQPQKNTLFITVLAGLTTHDDHDGQRMHETFPIAIVGSKNPSALQREVFRILQKIDLVKGYELNSQDMREGLKMSAMIRMKTPEYVEFHYPNETQQEKRERIVSIEQERSSDTYQVISLDK